MAFYITMEGPEATGKTTQAALLQTALQKQFPGREIILTKEPGSAMDSVCQQIRKVLLDPANEICDNAALLLFLADRAQHISKVVQPALRRDAIVISDRSSISTVVYHVAKQLVTGSAPSTGNYFYEMLDFAQQIRPNLCFITRADFDWCKDRLKERAQLDRIEAFGEEFHQLVHSLFVEIGTTSLPYSNGCIFGIRQRMNYFPNSVYLLPDSSRQSVNQIHEFVMNKCGDLIL